MTMVIVKEDTPTVQDTIERDARGRWQPGQSGNPLGHVKPEASLTSLLRKALSETLSDGRTRAEHIMERLVKLADDGDRQAIDMILDRTDGKPSQTLVHDTVRESKQSLLEGLAAIRNGGSDEQGKAEALQGESESVTGG